MSKDIQLGFLLRITDSNYGKNYAQTKDNEQEK